MKALVLLLVASLLLLSTAAFAAPCGKSTRDTVLANPDGRTSITFTGGIGTHDGLDADRSADLTNLGVALVYPASCDLSFLASYQHSKGEWSGAAPKCRGLEDWEGGVFTLGLRLYLGR